MTAVEPNVQEPSFEELAQRVDDAVAALADLDPAARKAAEELQGAIEAVHRGDTAALKFDPPKTA